MRSEEQSENAGSALKTVMEKTERMRRAVFRSIRLAVTHCTIYGVCLCSYSSAYLQAPRRPMCGGRIHGVVTIAERRRRGAA